MSISTTSKVPLIISYNETIKVGSSLSLTYNLGVSDFGLIKEISGIKNPKVIFWYVSDYGLRDGSVEFYKEKIGSILQLDQSECVLYDLKAWGAFRDLNRRITNNFKGDVRRINEIKVGSELYSRLKCKKSSDFFQWMIQETNQDVVSFVKNRVLARDIIFAKSKSYADSNQEKAMNIKVRDLFKSGCTMITEDIFGEDAEKCYSAFQYIEGAYLVMDFIEQALKEGQTELNLIFALPNDEAEYYPSDIFPGDLYTILRAKFGDQISGLNINVYFTTFKYADGSSKKRPYKEGKPIKKYEKM